MLHVIEGGLSTTKFIRYAASFSALDVRLFQMNGRLKLGWGWDTVKPTERWRSRTIPHHSYLSLHQ